jgi:hypothetical protein
MIQRIVRDLKLIVLGTLVVMVSYFGYKVYRAIHCVGSAAAPHAILPAKDTETVTYDSKKHVVTVVTAKGTTSEYANNPEVEIRKGGDVVIDRHLLGFENDWFFGAGYSDTTRLFLGDNFYHIYRFNFNGSIGGVPDSTKVYVRPYLGVGYNVWSNTSINLGIDPVNLLLGEKPGLAGFISVSF